MIRAALIVVSLLSLVTCLAVRWSERHGRVHPVLLLCVFALSWATVVLIVAFVEWSS